MPLPPTAQMVRVNSTKGTIAKSRRTVELIEALGDVRRRSVGDCRAVLGTSGAGVGGARGTAVFRSLTTHNLARTMGRTRPGGAHCGDAGVRHPWRGRLGSRQADEQPC